MRTTTAIALGFSATLGLAALAQAGDFEQYPPTDGWGRPVAAADAALQEAAEMQIRQMPGYAQGDYLPAEGPTCDLAQTLFPVHSTEAGSAGLC